MQRKYQISIQKLGFLNMVVRGDLTEVTFESKLTELFHKIYFTENSKFNRPSVESLLGEFYISLGWGVDTRD